MNDAQRNEIKEISNKVSLARWWLVPVAILALLAAGINFWLTAKYGLGMSPDSVAYIASARSLQAHQGFVNQFGRPIAVWPPLYPAVLTIAAGLSGWELPDVARGVNTFLLGCMTFCIYSLLRLLRFDLPWLRLAATLAIVVSIPVSFTSGKAWSDLLFSVEVLLLMILLVKSHESLMWTRSLAIGGLIAISFLTRYIGIVTLPVAVASLLLSKGDTRARLKHSAVVVLLALPPVALWLLRNYLLTETLMGSRRPASRGLLETSSDFGLTIVSWILPEFAAASIGSLAAAVPILLMAVLVTAAILIRPRSSLPIPLFIIAYSVMLLCTASIISFDPLGHRLLSPIAVPLFILIFRISDLMLQRVGLSRAVFVSAIVIIFLFRSLPVYLKYEQAPRTTGLYSPPKSEPEPSRVGSRPGGPQEIVRELSLGLRAALLACSRAT